MRNRRGRERNRNHGNYEGRQTYMLGDPKFAQCCPNLLTEPNSIRNNNSKQMRNYIRDKEGERMRKTGRSTHTHTHTRTQEERESLD